MMLKNAQKIDAKEMGQMMDQRKRFIDLHIRKKVTPS